MRATWIYRSLAVCLFLVLSLPCSTFAGIQVPTRDRFPDPAKVTIEPKENQGKDLFFNVLALHNSAKGVVKSFSVKVAERKSRLSFPRDSMVGQKFPEFKAKGPLGTLLIPVSGEISSGFGNRRLYRGSRCRFHTGIDIPAKPGTPIKTAAPGRVIYAGWRQGYGLMAEIDHGNGITTVYAHCSRLQVRLGETISSGNQVGQVGRTGVTTGPHLHFEVRRRGAVLDPMAFLSR